MRVIDLVIVAGWIAFWLYWFVAATQAKPGRGQWRRFTGARVAVIVVIIFLFRAVGLRAHSASSDPAIAAIGLTLFVAGLALAVWARLYIGRNWGTPMSKKDDPELVTSGPYRRVRHPIYTGLILAMIGTALATTLFGLIAAAVLAGFFIYSATREEAYLTEEFPDSYPPYKRSTKMLLPFVF